ncbi:MAG: hypothetical protein AVDCRST_MAG59-1084, partial [uncultured Thermomicrobiales bacterium]
EPELRGQRPPRLRAGEAAGLPARPPGRLRSPPERPHPLPRGASPGLPRRGELPRPADRPDRPDRRQHGPLRRLRPRLLPAQAVHRRPLAERRPRLLPGCPAAPDPALQGGRCLLRQGRQPPRLGRPREGPGVHRRRGDRGPHPGPLLPVHEARRVAAAGGVRRVPPPHRPRHAAPRPRHPADRARPLRRDLGAHRGAPPVAGGDPPPPGGRPRRRRGLVRVHLPADREGRPGAGRHRQVPEPDRGRHLPLGRPPPGGAGTATRPRRRPGRLGRGLRRARPAALSLAGRGRGAAAAVALRPPRGGAGGRL